MLTEFTSFCISRRWIKRFEKIRFCFYTSSGTETTGTTVGLRSDDGVLDVADSARSPAAATIGLAIPEDALPRSYSTSSIEGLLHQSQRTVSPIEWLESPFKSRASSCDDLVSFNGSLTPTPTPTKAQFKL